MRRVDWTVIVLGCVGAGFVISGTEAPRFLVAPFVTAASPLGGPDERAAPASGPGSRLPFHSTDPATPSTASPEAIVTRVVDPEGFSSFVDFAALAASHGVESRTIRKVRCSAVRATDGSPCANAEILVEPWSPYRSSSGLDAGVQLHGRTDRDGGFVVRTNLHVAVAVRAPGFAWSMLACGREDERDDGEKGEEEAEELTFELEPVVMLEGRVVDADGTPVRGGRLMTMGLVRPPGCWRNGCGNGWYSYTHTIDELDEEGRFGPVDCLAGIDAAIELVRKGAPSRFFPPISLDAQPGESRFVELRLPPRVVVRGRVRHEHDEPPRGVAVIAIRGFDHWSDRLELGAVDDEGLYELDLPAPGPYRLEVRPVGDDDAVIASRELFVTEGVTALDWLDPRPFEPEEEDEPKAPEEEEAEEEDQGEEQETDEEPEPEEIEPGEITGSIRCECDDQDEDDFHRHSALLLRDGRAEDQVDCESDGSFLFRFVSPGRYDVRPCSAAHARLGDLEVEVRPAETVELAPWLVHALPTWSGRVTTTRGEAVVDATIRLETEVPAVDESDGEITLDHQGSDGAGAFRIACFEGPCRLLVQRDGMPDWIQPLERTPVEEDFVVRVPPARAVSGAIVIPRGVPFHQLEIACKSADGVRLAEVRLDDSGRFELPQVPIDEVDVVLERRSGAHYWVEVVRRRVPAGDIAVELGTLSLDGRR